MNRMLAAALVLAVSALMLGAPRNAEAQVVKVLDYNVYLGADLNPITAAPNIIAAGIAGAVVFDQVRFQTDFAPRAQAITDIISREDPDVIGLQEVITYFMAAPSNGFALPATTLVQDFLQLILQGLNQVGSNYVVACQNFNADVELPVVGALGVPFVTDVRLVDSDVILVRDSVDVTNFSCASANYATQLSLDLPGCTSCCAGVGGGTVIPECVEFTRGYSTVEATIRGTTYVLANTHLEVFSGGAVIQSGQAVELVAGIAAAGGGPAGLPTIVTGDFNSEPTDVGFGATTMIGSAYVDNWPLSRRKLTNGLTCCQDGTLDNPTDVNDERIDYVWTSYTPDDVLATVQGLFTTQKSGSISGVCSGDGATRCPNDAACAAGPGGTCLLGNAAGAWPADHSAVVSRIRTP